MYFLYNQDISNYIYNYLIDSNINIYDDDTLLIKFQKILLKYKRIIAIVLLIILLIIGNQCNYIFINKKVNSYILYGGAGGAVDPVAAGGPAGDPAGDPAAATTPPKKRRYKSKYASKLKEGAVKRGKIARSAIKRKNIKAFADRRGQDIKDAAPWLMGIIYSSSIALLSFLIFMPAIGFIVVGIICFALLKQKMSYIKSL